MTTPIVCCINGTQSLMQVAVPEGFVSAFDKWGSVEERFDLEVKVVTGFENGHYSSGWHPCRPIFATGRF